MYVKMKISETDEKLEGNHKAQGIYERLFKQIRIAIMYQRKRSAKTADDAVSVP